MALTKARILKHDFPVHGNSRDRKNHDSQRSDRILCFFAPPGDRAIFSTFCGDFLTKLHRELGENGENNIPLEKIQKNPVETAPQNCSFLSLVVVERVLKFNSGAFCVHP